MKAMTTRLTVLLVAFVPSLGFAAPAMAQPGDGYSDEGAVVETQAGGGNGDPNGGGNGAATGTANDPGNLPFTGSDLELIGGGGVLVLGALIGMRLLTRGAQPDQTFAPSRRRQSPAA